MGTIPTYILMLHVLYMFMLHTDTYSNRMFRMISVGCTVTAAERKDNVLKTKEREKDNGKILIESDSRTTSPFLANAQTLKKHKRDISV